MAARSAPRPQMEHREDIGLGRFPGRAEAHKADTLLIWPEVVMVTDDAG